MRSNTRSASTRCSLVKYNLTFTEVFDALAKNNHNVGGGSLRQGDQMS